MKKKTLFHKFSTRLAVAILTGALLLSGCSSAGDASGQTSSAETTIVTTGEGTQVQTSSYGASAAAAAVTTIDINDMFSDRDLKGEYEEKECIHITLNGKEASCESSAVSIEDQVIIIKEAGYYILSGTYEGSIRVEAPEDAKVQLILDNATIETQGTAAIYGKTADKIFLTLAQGSSNKITNTGEFVAIDDNNIDGAIFSKCDLTLNGSGSLTVSSEKGHGVVSKDDLKITGGTYEITAGDHGISGKDSIRIADGTITIQSAQDGLHSGNEEDPEKGYVYIAKGTVTISAGDDAIHGESKVVIADGTIQIKQSEEGIEAAIVELAGGNVTVVSTDDGINASDDYILISGGKIVVDAQGDGIDSNGDVYVSGGETYVCGPEGDMNSALDYDKTAKITGGTFIAIGSSGMAMNFNDAAQGAALITASSSHGSGEKVELKDANGNVILSLTSTRKFSSVVVSSPAMKQGEKYTLGMGSETKEFTLDQLVYGQSFGFGGGMGGPGGFGGRGRSDGQEGGSEGRPEMPEGFDGSFEGMPEMPEGFDGSFEGMPQMPGGQGGGFEGMPGRRGGSSDGKSGDGKGSREGTKDKNEEKTDSGVTQS